MDLILDLKDKVYERVLGANLAEILRPARVCVGGYEAGGDEVVVRDGDFTPYRSVNDIACEIAERFPQLQIAGKRKGDPSNCIFAAVTAAGQARVRRDVSLALSEIYARIYGFETLFIDLDMLTPGSDSESAAVFLYRMLYKDRSPAALSLLPRDAYNLRSLVAGPFNPLYTLESDKLCELFNMIAESGLFARVVIDLPEYHPCFSQILSCCEKHILTAEREDALTAAFAASLPGPSSELVLFYTDPGADPSDRPARDLYSSFGTEVKGLAEQLESR